MKKIYVCSMVVGSSNYNAQKAIEFAKYVVSQGHIPIAPQIYLPMFLNSLKLTDMLFTKKASLELLNGCDELWYFGDGVTRDMVDAILAAHEKGIPVKYIPPMKMAALSCQKECIRERRDAFLNLNNDEIGGKNYESYNKP